MKVRYGTPTALPDRSPWYLVADPGTPQEQRFAFYDDVEIGRDDGRANPVGAVLVSDPRISRRHCVIGRRSDGQYFVRDTSRNGTRLDGRRLVPNIETELHSGQRLSVAPDVEFVVEGEAVEATATSDAASATVAMPASAFATLLVGDIRDYTVLVRRAPSAVLQQSVSRVFEALGGVVGEHGGTVKEYQGDALVAFWEGDVRGRQVARACRAALALDVAVRRLATDRSIWQVDDFALEMDFALATGPVMIDSFGGGQVTGLSMIGEPIVLAFRLEKFANERRGRILACRVTHQMAGPELRFRDLGEMTAKGFDHPDRVYALEGVEPGASTTEVMSR